MGRRPTKSRGIEELITEYRQHAGSDELAGRLIEVLQWAQSSGRLLLDPTVNPAFGIVGNAARRILSIREADGKKILGRISVFPSPERYGHTGEYAELCERLSAIAAPASLPNNPGSWDIASLAVLSDDQYRQFLDVLDWLGPAPASDAAPELPGRTHATISRVVRDSTLVRSLKSLHNDTCQICGTQVTGLHGWTYSEAHHIRPLGQPHNGPDVAENLLILCPNHHAMCDFGAIRLQPADLRQAGAHAVSHEYIRYHNDKIAREAS